MDLSSLMIDRGIPSTAAAEKEGHIRSGILHIVPLESPTLVFLITARTQRHRGVALEMGGRFQDRRGQRLLT
jgi:hypothetical protein